MTLREAIDTLKNKDITQTLKENGIRLEVTNSWGSGERSCNCPMANYLAILTGKTVYVDSVSISTNDEEVDTPENIKTWVIDFDTGRIK